MKIINLTSHTLWLVNGGGVEIKIKQAGICQAISKLVATGEYICGVKVVRRRRYEIIGLPEPKPGRVYLVSRIAAERIWRETGRQDVYAVSGPKNGQRENKTFYKLEANPYGDN